MTLLFLLFILGIITYCGISFFVITLQQIPNNIYTNSNLPIVQVSPTFHTFINDTVVIFNSQGVPFESMNNLIPFKGLVKTLNLIPNYPTAPVKIFYPIETIEIQRDKNNEILTEHIIPIGTFTPTVPTFNYRIKFQTPILI